MLRCLYLRWGGMGGGEGENTSHTCDDNEWKQQMFTLESRTCNLVLPAQVLALSPAAMFLQAFDLTTIKDCKLRKDSACGKFAWNGRCQHHQVVALTSKPKVQAGGSLRSLPPCCAALTDGMHESESRIQRNAVCLIWLYRISLILNELILTLLGFGFFHSVALL